MIEEKNEDRQSFDQDAVMVYIDPQLMQGLADVAAQKAANFQELLSAAQEGDLESAYQVALSYAKAVAPPRIRSLPFSGSNVPQTVTTSPPNTSWGCASCGASERKRISPGDWS